tara:strand:- start:1240 stop:1455 length:216 start_codon:yes stop_codon:yes gene_type:complete
MKKNGLKRQLNARIVTREEPYTGRRTNQENIHGGIIFLARPVREIIRPRFGNPNIVKYSIVTITLRFSVAR